MTNKSDKILAPIKGRIIQLIEIQGEKKEFFFKKLQIASSNFRGIALFSEVSAEIIAKILTKYPNVNCEWLITGKGSVFNDIKQSSQPQENDKYISSLEKQISLLEKNNALQEEKIAHLEKEIKRLKGKDIYIMEEKIENQRKEIATLKNQALANTPYIPPSARK